MKLKYLYQIKNELETEIANFEKILNATPISEIIKLRIEAQKVLDSNIPLDDKTKKLTILSEKEKKQFEIEKQWKIAIKSTERRAELAGDLSDINGEIWFKEHKNK